MGWLASPTTCARKYAGISGNTPATASICIKVRRFMVLRCVVSCKFLQINRGARELANAGLTSVSMRNATEPLDGRPVIFSNRAVHSAVRS